MDRVRFTLGEGSDPKVWQGFSRGEQSMSGDVVYVTSDTLRRVTDDYLASIEGDEWMRQHNGPENQWDLLAFGGRTAEASVLTAPDGITPIYSLGDWMATIVQRFNPNRGKAYLIFEQSPNQGPGTVGGSAPMPRIGYFGEWVNEGSIEGTPDPQGFVINEQWWSEGRTDTPPLLQYATSRA